MIFRMKEATRVGVLARLVKVNCRCCSTKADSKITLDMPTAEAIIG